MALIHCSECGREISDKANACPSCGNPIHPVQVEVPATVEIEQTSKKWKRRSLWSLGFLIVGVFMVLGSKNTLPWGILFIVISLIQGFTARVGAWWTNG